MGRTIPPQSAEWHFLPENLSLAPAPAPTPDDGRWDVSPTNPDLRDIWRASILTCNATNALRARYRLAPLAYDAALAAPAFHQAAYCATRGVLTHTRPDGSSSWDDLTKMGYGWLAAGENAAWNYPDAPSVVAGWYSSPGHRANLLGNYTRTATACVRGADGSLWWFAEYARPK